MKLKIILLLLWVFPSFTGIAQNPYKYETIVEIFKEINVAPGNPDFGMQGSTTSNLGKIQALSDKHNANGFKLIHMNSFADVGGAKVVLVFERSTSYREAELYKLINELTARIDTTSKKYTDSAMQVIQTNVLNYLKSIPNDVITQAYKDELTKIILAEAEDKIRKIIEELKKEIRNSSTGNK